MEIFYAVCAAITTISIVIITYHLVKMLDQTGKTAREIEKLSKNANNHLEATKDLLKTFNTIAESAGSVWVKAIKYGLAAAAGFNVVRKRLAGRKETD
jgi:uncharacterized protein YoxC